MSETGRKMDVEDVLSSIRRLVSEEARTASDTETPDETPSNSDANLLQHGNANGPDKLVLTPSLRVSESDSPAPAAAELEQRIADIESLVMSEAVDHADMDVTDQVDVQDPLSDPEELGTDTPAEFAEIVEDVTETVTEEVSADATSEMMSALHLSMKDFARSEPPLTANLSGAPSVEEAEDETATAPARDTLSFGSSDDTNVMDGAENTIEDAEFAEIEDEALLASDSPFEADLDDVPPAPDFMQGHDAEPADTFEDPEIEAAEPVRDTIVNREPPLTSPDPQPATAASHTLFEEPLDYTDDDSFLDEETLREMVSEMVRSELQGELGDRITRNVRKLVRREIHRALASRDFE